MDTDHILAELIKQNLMIGQQLIATNQRIDISIQRQDELLKQMILMREEFSQKHLEAVSLFYHLQDALERLPDVVKEQIGFKSGNAT